MAIGPAPCRLLAGLVRILLMAEHTPPSKGKPKAWSTDTDSIEDLR
jgi:hypothetical protein